MRISDWSSDVCSSDLARLRDDPGPHHHSAGRAADGSNRIGGVMIKKLSIFAALMAVPAAAAAPAAQSDLKCSGTTTTTTIAGKEKIGRASWRERVCQYV